MNRAKCQTAAMLLNNYAHEFLGLAHDVVMIAGAAKKGSDEFLLIVATEGGCQQASGFDECKALIDKLPTPN